MNRARKNRLRISANTSSGKASVVAMNALHGSYLAEHRMPAGCGVTAVEMLVVIETEEDLNAAKKIIEHFSQFFKTKK